MKITKIITENFKAGTFECSLSPVMVITGPNFVGKSSRVEALELALRGTFSGKSPGSGMTNAELYDRFASGDPMVVHVETDNGWSLSRRWKAGKKSVDRQDGFKGFPDGYVAPAILFDHSVFTSLSDRERTNYLFRVLAPPDLAKIGPATVVAELKNFKSEPHTEVTEQAVRTACDWVDKSWKDGTQVQQWLEGLVESARLEANGAVARAKTMKETLIGVAQLKEPDETLLATAERKVAEARKVLDDVASQEVLAKERYRRATEERGTVEKLSVAPDMSGLAAKLTKAEENFTRLVTAVVDPVEQSTVDTARGLRDEMLGACSRLELLHGKAEAGVKNVDARLAAAEGTKTCPTCGHDVTDRQKVVIANLKAELEKCQTEADEWWKKWEVAKADAIKVAAEYGKAVNGKSAYDIYQNEYRSAKHYVQNLQHELREADPKRAEALKAQEALPALKQAEDVAGSTAQAMSEARAKANTAYQEAALVHRQAVSDSATAKQSVKARANAEKAQAEAAVYKHLSEYLSALLTECVSRSVQPLVDSCNQLAGPVLANPVAFEGGEIGVSRGGTFISLKACSDGEQMLVTASLRLALATKVDFKLVIIGRFESLDPDAKDRFLSRALELVTAGSIDQVIVVEVRPARVPASERFGKIFEHWDGGQFSVVEVRP